MASAGTYRETGTAMSCRVIPVSAALMLLLVSIVQGKNESYTLTSLSHYSYVSAGD